MGVRIPPPVPKNISNFEFRIADLFRSLNELGKDLKRLADAWNLLSPEEKVEFARVNRNTPPKQYDSVVRMIWERYRSPEAALDEMIDPRPDEFFKKLLIRWGEEHIQDTVENPSFILYRDELIRQRAEELYPGFNFDEQ